nr:hypothetical protein [Stenotrophomonas maltophilia]
MPVEILIAPAAPAAEAVGTFWKVGLPIITLLLGFLLKAGFDYFMEGDREERQKRLRKEQRFDAIRMRRLDSERENLLALQPLIVAYIRAAKNVYSLKVHPTRKLRHLIGVGPIPSNEELLDDAEAAARELGLAEEEMWLAAASVAPVRSRLHSTEVVAAVDLLLNVVEEKVAGAHKSQWRWEDVDGPLNAVHGLIGTAIKQLEGENQQLGDPSAR